MNIKTRLLICTVAITCGIAGIALATPIVGLNFNNILAFGTINTEVLDRARVALVVSGLCVVLAHTLCVSSYLRKLGQWHSSVITT